MPLEEGWTRAQVLEMTIARFEQRIKDKDPMAPFLREKLKKLKAELRSYNG